MQVKLWVTSPFTSVLRNFYCSFGLKTFFSGLENNLPTVGKLEDWSAALFTPSAATSGKQGVSG